MDLTTGAIMALVVWLAGSVAAAAVIGRGIRLRDEREPRFADHDPVGFPMEPGLREAHPLVATRETTRRGPRSTR
jgi:hypothetical protein